MKIEIFIKYKDGGIASHIFDVDFANLSDFMGESIPNDAKFITIQGKNKNVECAIIINLNLTRSVEFTIQ